MITMLRYHTLKVALADQIEECSALGLDVRGIEDRRPLPVPDDTLKHSLPVDERQPTQIFAVEPNEIERNRW
jgi:hypothetical protein